MERNYEQDLLHESIQDHNRMAQRFPRLAETNKLTIQILENKPVDIKGMGEQTTHQSKDFGNAVT